MKQMNLRVLWWLAIGAAGAVLGAGAGTAWAQEADDFVPNRFIVEVDESGPARSPALMAALRKDRVREAVAARRGIVRDSFERVMQALVVEVSESERPALEALPGVRKVYRVRRAQFEMDRARQLVRAPEAWRITGGDDQAGKGIKIGIVDTGIDKDHPAFQDEALEAPAGFPKFSKENDATGLNKKVIVARSYGRRGNPDIRDLSGHGSGVASVAAGVRHQTAVGEFSGIAPRAFLGMYRLDDADGSFTSDGVLRALEDVAQDGMDVVNLSIGFFPQSRPEDDAVTQAVERIAGKVIVAKSAGNMGPDPGLASSPSTGAAITVGASWNDRALGPSVEVPGIGGLLAVRPDADLPAAPLDGALVDAAREGDAAGMLCAAPAEGAFQDKIVLILRGDCFFEDKLKNALRGGAAGAIIYTNSNPVPTFWAAGDPLPVPAVMVTNEHGLRMKSALAERGGLTVRLWFDLGSVTVDANQMASFSSRGPGLGASIHVDLVAPGDDIFLAAQKVNPAGALYNSSGYTVEGGTSFSSPMAAGAAAVVKAARPGLTVKQYKSLLVNSASPFARSSGVVFGPQVAGAGRLDVERALRATVAADPVSVSFGIGPLTNTVTRELTLTNLGSQSDTIAIEVSPLGSSGPAPVVSPATITLRAGESRVVSVRFSGAELTPGEHHGFLIARGSLSEVEARIGYWYGASNRIPRTIALVPRTLTPQPGGAFQFVMRIADAAGAALMDPQPEIEPLEGGGAVDRLVSQDAMFPGIWQVTLRLGPVPGVPNVFRFKVGETTRTITIRP